jgi:hypothetical protein
MHHPRVSNEKWRVAMHRYLTAIAQNFGKVGLILPVCLLGWKTLAPAAEPVVIQVPIRLLLT